MITAEFAPLPARRLRPHSDANRFLLRHAHPPSLVRSSAPSPVEGVPVILGRCPDRLRALTLPSTPASFVPRAAAAQTPDPTPPRKPKPQPLRLQRKPQPAPPGPFDAGVARQLYRELEQARADYGHRNDVRDERGETVSVDGTWLTPFRVTV
jgi:hypothetical protein